MIRGQNRYPDKESSDGKSTGSTSSAQAPEPQQHALSAAGLPPQRSVHEDVTQFLAAFNGDRAQDNTKHAAQVEEFLNAVSHQLPSCCFRMSFDDDPLLRGVGAQFEQKKDASESRK